ncbi:Eukaryotic translation initiation factor 3 subunit G [Forsythia ovata]|uniref:Eukaryotic translation initiation factor 3 subunit G n=1 Tax=Forsythia ovata TaxID=205694 RepID=A0ABD1T9Q1_9LAMI
MKRQNNRCSCTSLDLINGLQISSAAQLIESETRGWLEEYETAKTTLENGASLAPRNSRFINFIKECDECRASTKQEEVKVAGDALASMKNIGATITVCMKCFKKGEHYTSMCPYLNLLLQSRPSLIGRLHQKTQLFQPMLPMEHTFLQA